MHRHFRTATASTGATRALTRLSSIVGAAPEAVVPEKKKESAMEFLRRLSSEAPTKDVPDTIGTPVGAALGLLFVPRHRVLGALGGASLGRNAPALLSPETRKPALRNLAGTGTAIVFSLAVPRHSVLSYIVGEILGSAGAYFGGLR